MFANLVVGPLERLTPTRASDNISRNFTFEDAFSSAGNPGSRQVPQEIPKKVRKRPQKAKESPINSKKAGGRMLK
jgi:hypothetical protein